MPVLSDADMGITGESAAPLPRGRVLSDADMGIAPQTSVASVTKSAGAGVVRGALGAAGVGGGVREYNASALSRLLKAAGYDVPVETISKGLRVLPIMNAPSSKELTGATESVTGPLYEPQTTAEKVAHTLGEFVPAVLGGEGNLVRRLATNVIAPALASETAGELTKGSAFEPYARAGAAVLTPFAGGAASRLTGARTTTAPRFVKNVAGVDVPLSPGQARSNVSEQILENASLRGARGNPAQQTAEQFFNREQALAVENARAAVQRNLDRFGQTVADNPQEAGEIAAEATRNIERTSRGRYGRLYDEALAMPGEFHAGAFEGVGQQIRNDLSFSRDPVIIDDITTPVASRAIQHIDANIGQLRIQNRADPFGQPNPQNIVGVNLSGVDQARKQLIAMARATERGGADRRAMDRVIGAFDDHVENAMADGLFTGDDRALDALRDARAAYRQHSQTFRSQGAGDDVGRAMERIVGRNGGDGATPTEVANWLYGNAKVGGTGLSVRLAQRVRNVLGQDSPEWAAVRQGLWSRLSEAIEGTTAMGPQKAANRISEFLNGSGRPLAQIMFTGAERDLMARYAGLQRQLIPRPGAVNYSNRGVLMSALKTTGNSLAVLLGAAIGGPVGAFVGHMATPLGSRLRENLAAGSLSRSLYETRRTRPPMPPGLGRRAAVNAAIGACGGSLALPAPAQASAPQDQNDPDLRRALIRAVMTRQFPGQFSLARRN